MRNFFKRHKQVDIVLGHAIEIKPDHQYIIVFDRNVITMADADRLNRLLGKLNATGMTVLIDGEPDKSIKVLETKQEDN